MMGLLSSGLVSLQGVWLLFGCLGYCTLRRTVCSLFHPGLKAPQGSQVCQRQLLGPFSCLLSCPFLSRCLVLQTWDGEELVGC